MITETIIVLFVLAVASFVYNGIIAPSIRRQAMPVNRDPEVTGEVEEARAAGSSEPACSVLSDATKGRISIRGQALLQWGFDRGYAHHSIQMPEEVVDQILAWRDEAQNKAISGQTHSKEKL